MAVTLGGSIKVAAYLTDDRTAVVGAASQGGRIITDVSAAWLVASGIAAGQGDKVWGDIVTVTTGATVAHDLATGGNLTDAYGAAVVIAKLRAVVMVASGLAGVANTTTLQLARPAGATGVPLFAAISDALAPISAGGMIVWTDPLAGVVVTATSADLINVINSAGASAGYSMVFVGTSA